MALMTKRLRFFGSFQEQVSGDLSSHRAQMGLASSTVLFGSWDGYITPVQNLDPPQSFLLRILSICGFRVQTIA